jgi:hypothetical protein
MSASTSGTTDKGRKFRDGSGLTVLGLPLRDSVFTPMSDRQHCQLKSWMVGLRLSGGEAQAWRWLRVWRCS